jgi:hypothetical protein
MVASIRGHQAQFLVYENGSLSNIVNLVSVDVTQESSFQKTYYVGQAIPEGDQAIEGWTGNVEAQVKDAEVDKFIDALVTNNLNGIGVSDYSFIVTENYGDGNTASWVYYDVQWKMGRKQAGLNEKVTKRLEFQAMGRKQM